MWLIDTTSLELQEFSDERGVEYAILSHRWEEQEVLFRHVPAGYNRDVVEKMKGFGKIRECCNRARQQGLRYAWVDTCCIDKSSSAELQEAINSMFRWYSSARVCYAYLSDVAGPDPDHDQLRASQWFKRGWTLQELLAPKELIFFDHDWRSIGTRQAIHATIHGITRIKESILLKGFTCELLEKRRILVVEVMSWAKDRQTTRIEDRAYSLMGLFGVNMTMLYGEGESAFRRLQEEILRRTSDQTIFVNSRWGDSSCLARSPDDFDIREQDLQVIADGGHRARFPSAITNEGIVLTVDLLCWTPYTYLAVLNTTVCIKGSLGTFNIGIFLRRVSEDNHYMRERSIEHGFWTGHVGVAHTKRTSIILINKLLPHEVFNFRWYIERPYAFRITVRNWQSSRLRGKFRCQTIAEQEIGSRTATWNEEQDVLSLQPGACGFVGAVAIGESSISAHTAIVIALGFFGDFVPHCALFIRAWKTLNIPLLAMRELDHEAQKDSRWRDITDLPLPENDTGIKIESEGGTTSAECIRLQNKTLLLRSPEHDRFRSPDGEFLRLNLTFSVPRKDGRENVCSIEMGNDIDGRDELIGFGMRITYWTRVRS